MTRRPPSTTLFIYPASSSPLALIIRRGPSKWWHFLLWNRNTGVVKPGSWLNGMVYPHRCDLSPKGDAMLLLAYRGAKTPVTWTALCSPPNVSAEVFWQHKSANFGGGFFDGRIPAAWINLVPGHMEVDVRQERDYEFGYLEPEQPFFGSAEERLRRDGWKRIRTGRWQKLCPKKKQALLLDLEESRDANAKQCPLFDFPLIYSLKTGDQENQLEGVTWAGWNTRGELTLSMDGKLFVADPASPRETLRLVFDLTGLKHPVRQPLPAKPANPAVEVGR